MLTFLNDSNSFLITFEFLETEQFLAFIRCLINMSYTIFIRKDIGVQIK